MRLTIGGRVILTDPYLGAKYAYQSLAGKSQNPTVDLPGTIEQAVSGAEMALVSHLHNDHFDPAAQAALPKSLPLYCQPGDEGRIAEKGFLSVTPVATSVTWEGVRLTRTGGTHGTGEWGDKLNPVSGFILRADGEPSLYWCGDTVWCDEVREVIEREKSDIIVTHSGGAKLEDSGPIVMDAAQTVEVCRRAPDACVVAIHLEALDHCLVTRAALRQYATRHGVGETRLLIPADGETLAF